MTRRSRSARFRVPGGLIVAAVCAACGAPEKNATTPPETLPDFFVANRWTDQDRSGGADYWEFEGANKWTFRSEETITFVSRIECNLGSIVAWSLHAPDGAIFDEGSSEQRWPSTWRRAYSGPVIELLDAGGPGVWWVDWSVDGLPVGKCAANLAP